MIALYSLKQDFHSYRHTTISVSELKVNGLSSASPCISLRPSAQPFLLQPYFPCLIGLLVQYTAVLSGGGKFGDTVVRLAGELGGVAETHTPLPCMPSPVRPQL